ncbi:unnamed protein product [Blepharisma stoltei]|uniref:Uncharacterized protein n=1 Tax=Blepharisma stoltei TaxID=1481888 RepID=A0AAU9KEE2_9CILI|nr:unnamed protein product [Blepharisma stoltei]
MNTENVNPNLPTEELRKNKMFMHEIKDKSLISRIPLQEKEIFKVPSLNCTEILMPTQLDLDLYEIQRLYKQNYREANLKIMNSRKSDH